MILDSSFPPDSRVENEAISLIKAGYEVHLFSLCYKKLSPQKEIINGIQVHRYYAGKFIYKLSALAYTFSFYHRLIESRIKDFLLKNRISAIHVHDMVVAEAVFNVNKKLKIPLVLDLHENRPEIMRYYSHVNSFSGRFLINLKYWKKKQNELITKADRVIVVTEEAKKKVIEETASDPDKIHVVPNTVSPEIFYSYPVKEEIIKKYASYFTVLYTGDTGIRRGTDTAIEAVHKLVHKIPNVRLVFVGRSKNDDVILKSLAKKLGVEKYVDFCGWQDVSLFPSYILASDVCTSPLHRNPHHDTTYANKIFQYMAMGKPLLVSDCPPQAAIVEKENCGLIHMAGDAVDMAEKILYLFENPQEARAMGENAKKALNEKYTWEILSQNLIRLYDRLKVKS